MDENIIYNADGIFIINFNNSSLDNNIDIKNNEEIYMKPIQNIVNTNFNLNYNQNFKLNLREKFV